VTHHVVIETRFIPADFYGDTDYLTRAKCACGWRSSWLPENEAAGRAAEHVTETEKEAA
jgi:hypothetical protein